MSTVDTRCCAIDASALAVNQSTLAARTYFEAGVERWIAPALFRVEVRNALVRPERRELLPSTGTDEGLALLEAEIDSMPSSDTVTLTRSLALARRHRLGVYDAVYLDLALSSNSALASRDSALLAIADGAGIEIRDLR